MNIPQYTTVQNAVKEIEEAAYQRGWNDCKKAIMAAAGGDGTAPAAPAQYASKFKFKLKKRTGRRGAVPAQTAEYISENPGLTGVDVIAGLQRNDPKINERTVRTAFARLRGKTIENRDGKWYPI